MPIFKVGLATHDDLFYGRWVVKAEDIEHAEIRAMYKSRQQWNIPPEKLYIFELEEIEDAEPWMGA
jgi:hypothetical protein